MYFHNSNAVKRATSLVSVSRGMPKELQPRFPLLVPRVSARRARAMTAEQTLKDQLDPATQPVWFQRHSGLYTPYWSTDEYQARFKKDPAKQLTHPRQIFVPYWMNDKRGNMIQRPHLGNHTASRVLFTIGDDTDGLGKGFKPFKAVTRFVAPATKIVGSLTKAVTKAIPQLLPIAAGGAAAIFGGPAGMMMAGPLMAALSPQQKQQVEQVATQGGVVPSGLPDSYYQGAGVQPGQYITPMNASRPTAGALDVGPPLQATGSPQGQQAGGIDPMYIMMGGGAALLLTMLMLQRKG